MLNNVLIEALKRADIIRITLFLGAFYICWLILLELGYYFLNRNINKKEVLLYSLIGMFFGYIGRAVLKTPVFYLCNFTVYIFLLKISTKQRWINTIFAAMFVYLSTTLSVFLIGNPLLLLGSGLKTFLLESFGGMLIGIIIETIIPLTVLFFCYRYKVEIFPHISFTTKLYILFFIMFTSLVFLFYRSVQRAWLYNGNGRFYEISAAAAGLLCFLGVKTLIKQYIRSKEIEQSSMRDAHKKDTEQLIITYEKKLDYSFGCFCGQSTDTIRNCILAVTEALHENEKNLPKISHKLMDISLAEAGGNPILKYILMTKRLCNFSSGTQLYVHGASELRDYYDMDFWSLVSKILDIVGKTHHELDHMASHTPREVITFNAVYLTFYNYPEQITLSIETNWPPDTIYKGWHFLEHHLNPVDRDVYKRLLCSDEKLSSYGVSLGKIVRVQLTCSKWTFLQYAE